MYTRISWLHQPQSCYGYPQCILSSFPFILWCHLVFCIVSDIPVAVKRMYGCLVLACGRVAGVEGDVCSNKTHWLVCSSMVVLGNKLTASGPELLFRPNCCDLPSSCESSTLFLQHLKGILNWE